MSHQKEIQAHLLTLVDHLLDAEAHLRSSPVRSLAAIRRMAALRSRAAALASQLDPKRSKGPTPESFEKLRIQSRKVASHTRGVHIESRAARKALSLASKSLRKAFLLAGLPGDDGTDF